MRSPRSRSVSHSLCTLARSERSTEIISICGLPLRARTSWPASGMPPRHGMITRAPREASSTATALPRPELLPVTITVRPSSRSLGSAPGMRFLAFLRPRFSRMAVQMAETGLSWRCCMGLSVAFGGGRR
jgi:hypothetical protein